MHKLGQLRNQKSKHLEKILLRCPYITRMITLRIELNTLYVPHIPSISVNCVAQVPPHAIWLRNLRKKVYCHLDRVYRADIGGSNTEKRLIKIGSIVQESYQRLMSLLNNHHATSLTYLPCSKYLNQGKKCFNDQCSILNNDETVQLCWNVSSGWLEVAI